MEEDKVIQTWGGSVSRKDGEIYLQRAETRVHLGHVAGFTARQYAHAILELIGDPVPGKGDDCYIAVNGRPDDWIGGQVLNAISMPSSDPIAALADTLSTEFHIFRRVATVGPIPQPERKVTRYE